MGAAPCHILLGWIPGTATWITIWTILAAARIVQIVIQVAVPGIQPSRMWQGAAPMRYRLAPVVALGAAATCTLTDRSVTPACLQAAIAAATCWNGQPASPRITT